MGDEIRERDIGKSLRHCSLRICYRTTTLISVSSTGVQGNGGGHWPGMSADGRYVVFYSASNNLVPNDTNGGYEVFLRDLTSGTTERVNIPSAGGQAVRKMSAAEQEFLRRLVLHLTQRTAG